MPVLESTYKSPVIFRNAHISTIYAAVLRKVKFESQERERIELEDYDFLDIDWTYSKKKRSNKLIILLHGLAGDAQRPYMRGMAKQFFQHDYDAAAINFRSCSGEINRLYRSYNAGATEDLSAVIDHVIAKEHYKEIILAGFSLGGNLLLKYLGETQKLPEEIKAGIAISTPCDLKSSLDELSETRNYLYSKRFEKNLKEDLYARQEVFPEHLKREDISNCNSLLAIDELYTSKAHGYKSASDYYQKCSCLQFLGDISIPTLLLNAKDDTFLSENSYPVSIAQESEFLYLEMPEHGGHVGFIQNKAPYYHEKRALEFAKTYAKK